MSRRRRLLLAVAAGVAAVAVVVGIWVHDQLQPVEKRGSAKQEFDARDEPKGSARTDRRPWPTYGYDRRRTHFAPFRHRPPYRRVWQIDGHNTLEFPPTIGYGHVYLAQQKGLFFALKARTGRLLWRKSLNRCSAASPTIGRGVVYMSWMDHECDPNFHAPDADGFLIAWDAKTGRRKWKYKAKPLESSPLLVRHTLYVGGWDHKVHAVNARNGHRRWTFTADDEVNTSAAYWRGTVYIASDGGTVYALNARTGRLRWSAQSKAKFGSREFFYASPTVAYGRVFIGNSDGTMYVYGAKSGKLLWARPLGSYIYSAAAVWKRRVYVGTYDGWFYALDAATGDVKWKRSAPGAVHAAPTVMDGLVYYATCSSCGAGTAQRAVKAGPDGTFALDARTGRRVWSFPAGKYANPVVADRRRIYVTGRAALFALAPKKSHRSHRRGGRSRRRR
jgi:outer membrane protein assembly factor BamB